MDNQIDILTEYKNISNNLKKRFLKKPNISECSHQFALLSKKLTSDGCFNYSAFCQLAQARCEHSLENWISEVSSLIEAARLFLTNEKSIRDINCPSFLENLNSSINCYSHAIRVYLENSEFQLAAYLCIEVSEILKEFNMNEESIQHYQRATELLQQNPMECLTAMNLLAIAKFKIKDFDGALNTYTEMYQLANESCFYQNAHQLNGFYKDILRNCEISQLLLLLYLKPTPTNVSVKHSRLLEKFSWEANEDDILNCYMEEDLLLLLQSLIMAIQSQEKEIIQQLKPDIDRYLNKEQRDILLLFKDD